MGYVKAQAVLKEGVNVYEEGSYTSKVIMHIECGEEFWIKIINGSEWAEVYKYADQQEGFVNWNEVVIVLKKEEEELEPRSLVLKSSMDSSTYFELGDTITMTAELSNFKKDDNYECTWYYSEDGGANYILIDGATELTYQYTLNADNCFYRWRVIITLIEPEDGVPKEDTTEE